VHHKMWVLWVPTWDSSSSSRLCVLLRLRPYVCPRCVVGESVLYYICMANRHAFELGHRSKHKIYLRLSQAFPS
jgi:hypothetical protein